MPLPSNALHACLVTSTKAHARIVFVDLQEAQQCSGFVAYLCAKDITGCNFIGAVVKDEEVFATEYVKHYGAVR
jgi:xanthine dehydrogenase/oxidase